MLKNSAPYAPLLKQLVDFLNTNSPDARGLWFILTALRGPDTPDPTEELKSSITAVVRDAIGLQNEVGNCAVVSPDNINKAAYRTLLFKHATSTDHFLYHAQSAFAALGLIWSEDNSRQ